MGKRIEDFTAEELGEVFWGAKGHQVNDMAPVLDYIKANLDTGKREPMSVEEIRGKVLSWCRANSQAEIRDDDIAELVEIVQPLTVQQGFVPDWSKAPEWANCVSLYWARMHGSDRSFHGEAILFDNIPRPAPKMRQKTREEKVAEIVAKIGDNGMLWEYSDEVVDYICRAAGIPIEVAE